MPGIRRKQDKSGLGLSLPKVNFNRKSYVESSLKKTPRKGPRREGSLPPLNGSDGDVSPRRLQPNSPHTEASVKPRLERSVSAISSLEAL
jgi:hypothetical protein